ncbi:MAG: Xaa-Pro dipeptidase [Gammaproteobacteria bacterium]|nr:Xaa-Pro dipeptidase [Gammaproteobacteria bacterium]MDH4315402.1 Xaa-Pro dipeptidase [Gammaproteobacteria bacterium]MDH5212648.1 Xaa-Pro dipeptidase [Gammaproteobacteria bacterium]
MTNTSDIDKAALGRLFPGHVREIQARHERALERAGAAHAVIFAGAPKPVFLDDYNYNFKANPHFLSWVPLLTNPWSLVVCTPGEKPVLVYFQEKDYWHTPPADPDGFWTDVFDIRIVHTVEDIARHLPQALNKCIYIGEAQNDAQAFGIERINPKSAINILHRARGTKTEYEVACMRAASRRGARGHRAAEAAFREQASEFEIHLAYCKATEHTEKELPYGNIIALNEHSAVLHYQHQSLERPAAYRSFLIDAGARVNGYASDITRTYSFDNADYAALIKRFDALQLSLVAEVSAGMNFAELHLRAHRLLADLLVEVDLARGSADALIESGVTSAFYPHGLGHLLGLQVHDMGGFMADDEGTRIDPPSGHPFLRLTRTLEENQVLTIEPGLYVIDLLLADLAGTPGEKMINPKRVDWLRPFGGMRIEDNVRVTASGSENLTRDAFAAA